VAVSVLRVRERRRLKSALISTFFGEIDSFRHPLARTTLADVAFRFSSLWLTKMADKNSKARIERACK